MNGFEKSTKMNKFQKKERKLSIKKKEEKKQRVEKQELYCHGCSNYVQFELDLSVDGNYEINCPNCGHTHYRIIKDGKITEDRWGTSNTHFTTINNATYTNQSTFTNYVSSSDSSTSANFLYESWMNATTSASS